MKSYAQILDDIETLMQDAGVDPEGAGANSVFGVAELDALMPMALVTVSQYKPWQYKRTKTTVADSYDLTLTTGDKWRLLTGSGYKGTGIVKAEYEVDEDPRQFRGLTKFGDVISLELDSAPDSAVSVYLYMNKIHILQKAIGTTDDLAGVVTAAAGATSLSITSLGTGTINEMTTIAITGDSTVYYVTATASITANAATVSIWPPLATAAVAAVVTLSLTDSTLDMILEGYLARWLAATACISKATKSYSQVNAAIATIALAATAISAIAALITAGTGDITSGRAAAVLGATAIAKIEALINQAVSDFSTGRTQAAQVPTILDLANTEIDKILARLTQATTDIADGKLEITKLPSFIASAGTAIGTVTTRVTQALTDIASARTAIGLGMTAIKDADIEKGISDTHIGLAETALKTGSTIINTVTLGSGATEYMAQANADINVAQGHMTSGQGLLQKATAEFGNASVDYAAADRELETASARIREGMTILSQANATLSTNTALMGQAGAQLRLAQGYFQEAQGFIMEANARMAVNNFFIQLGQGLLSAASGRGQEAAADHANANTYLSAAASDFRAASEKANEAIANLRLVATRLQVSAGGLRYEQWGRQELALVKQDLLNYGGLPRSVRYPRD